MDLGGEGGGSHVLYVKHSFICNILDTSRIIFFLKMEIVMKNYFYFL